MRHNTSNESDNRNIKNKWKLDVQNTESRRITMHIQCVLQEKII